MAECINITPAHSGLDLSVGVRVGVQLHSPDALRTKPGSYLKHTNDTLPQQDEVLAIAAARRTEELDSNAEGCLGSRDWSHLPEGVLYAIFRQLEDLHLADTSLVGLFFRRLCVIHTKHCWRRCIACLALVQARRMRPRHLVAAPCATP